MPGLPCGGPLTECLIALVQLQEWMKDAGLRTWVDAVGSVHGRAGEGSGGRALLLGSHYDTVVDGGKFDGALGIVLAIAAVKALSIEVQAPPVPCVQSCVLAAGCSCTSACILAGSARHGRSGRAGPSNTRCGLAQGPAIVPQASGSYCIQ